MKVKCIDKVSFIYITVNKTYDIIHINKYGDYWIIDDNEDEVWWYPKEWFKPLYEIRNEKINKLLKWK